MNSQIDDLKHDNLALRKNLRDQVKKLADTTRELQVKYKQETQQAQARFEKIHRSLQEKNFELDRNNENLKDQLQFLRLNHRAEKSRAEEYIRDMEEREKRRSEKIKELQFIQEKYEYEIQQAQLSSFRNMKQGRWLPLEESDVVGKIELLNKRIKQWAKSAAMKTMNEVYATLKHDPAEEAILRLELSAVVRMQNGVLPLQLSEGKQAPFLCLNAILANDIYMRILADPFFFLEDDISFIIDSLPADSSIIKQRQSPNILYRDMYQKLMTGSFFGASFFFVSLSPRILNSNFKYATYFTVDAREAHIWRSQMLRILSLSFQDDPQPGEKGVKQETEARRQQVCTRHARSFWEGPARHLWSLDHTHGDDAASSDQLKRLDGIFQAAGSLSYQLWTQRTYFRCHGLKDLEDQSFSIDSAALELHPLVHLDEAPTRLDGHPIVMVVNPFVQVYGTDEAEDYHQSRVWAKAVVWLPL